MNDARMESGGITIGKSAPCFIIAEAGVNHDGDLDKAIALVDVAADARADAVKFQTFRADQLATVDAPQAEYQRSHTGAVETQLEMLRRLELPAAAFRRLRDHCRQVGIRFLSTPFDLPSLELLVSLDVAFIKVGSGELTNYPFLAACARTGRGILLSTGMADLAEVKSAIDVIRTQDGVPLALLHCVSRYPCPVEEANVRAMDTLASEFSVPVGYSDHTLGLSVALAAVARGARILEKHFTLDPEAAGPDHKASLSPGGLRELVRAVREVEACLGSGEKVPASSEYEIAAIARRSLVAAHDLARGHVVTEEDIVIRRPGTGLAPGELPAVIGRRLKTSLAEGSLFTKDILA